MRRYNFQLRDRINRLRRQHPKASLGEIAQKVGVSKQRVHQILQSPLPEYLIKSQLRAIQRVVKRTKREVEAA